MPSLSAASQGTPERGPCAGCTSRQLHTKKRRWCRWRAAPSTTSYSISGAGRAPFANGSPPSSANRTAECSTSRPAARTASRPSWTTPSSTTKFRFRSSPSSLAACAGTIRLSRSSGLRTSAFSPIATGLIRTSRLEGAALTNADTDDPKYTVLGASGFIGGHLAAHFRKAGVRHLAPPKWTDDVLHRPLGHVLYCIGLTADWRSRPHDTVRAHVERLL